MHRSLVPVSGTCKADWDAMSGDDLQRFCYHCEKDVWPAPKPPARDTRRTRPPPRTCTAPSHETYNQFHKNWL